MTVLNIAGHRVTVDDSFQQLSPDEQNATVAEIAKTLGSQPAPQPDNSSVVPGKTDTGVGRLISGQPADPRDSIAGRVDAFGRGVADTLSFGLADEIAAQAKSGPLSVQRPPDEYYNSGIYAGEYNPLGAVARFLNAPFASDTKDADYNKALADERAVNASDEQNRGGYRLAGQITGGVAGGAGLAKSGLSLTANAVNRGASLGRVAAAGAGEGAILGGAQGFGSGEGGFLNRLQSGAAGGAIGLAAGAAAPYVAAGAGSFLRSLLAPITSRLNPAPAANRALGTAMQRAGVTADDVANSIQSAINDGQQGYAVADAIGNAGQRMLSSVARTPNDARQEVVNQLLTRQAGQGERLSNAIAEGFAAPDTAAQRAATLTGARDAEANQLYGAARRDAGAVNVSPVLDTIDQTLSPGVNQVVNPRDNIGYDTIEGALARVRNMLSDGNSQVTDFNTLFRAKMDVDDMIQRATNQGANWRANALGQVQREINNALAAASPSYRQAAANYAERSGVIDAVDAGTAAASGRTRAADNIGGFNVMTPDQQQAFRAGYADPLVTRVEAAASSPTTNKARMLVTPKYESEFQAFAAPGMGDQLGNRVAREQRMFETMNQAIGGSRTADNLADMSDIANFDPAVLTNLFSGNLKTAAVQAAVRVLNEGKGMPPRVIDRIGRGLMETDPQAAQNLLTVASSKVTSDTAKRGLATAILNNLVSAAPGRIAASN
ncbi:hypothetical protein [Rhizobium hainanense]|uniref:Uncharacterized protein n=1 Tax=Rhizobium hainanense TaxID=52131 RepID=A0A1C3UMG0_9HYPH|nr:hypothetical protein [Rhizobium hainanense]SCB16527.1 hypothetical protein GA0061100_102623 [Rhizobium hainanense]